MNLLTNEQIAYLKSLESKKKRREFLLDCLIGNITAQEVDFEIPINYGKFENDGTGFNTTTAPRTFTETLNKIRQYYEKDLNFNEEISEAIDKMILKNEPLKFDAKEEDGCIKVSRLPSASNHISYEEHMKWFNETFNTKGEEKQDVESEKIDSSKITDSFGYLLPKKYKEFLEFTNSDTTAPRTFYAIDEERKNYRIGEIVDFVAEEVKKEISKTEEYKWDKNPKLEDIIKSKLIIRGFKNEDLLNNRGLIGATIDETVIEVVKNYPFCKYLKSIEK